MVNAPAKKYVSVIVTMHHATKILLATAPVRALMPAATSAISIRHVVAALHGMLRHRIQCIHPADVGRGYFPSACDMLRRVPCDYDRMSERIIPDAPGARRAQVAGSERCIWSMQALCDVWMSITVPSTSIRSSSVRMRTALMTPRRGIWSRAGQIFGAARSI